MSEAHGTRVQEFIGDPVSEAPVVSRDELEEVFDDIQSDLRYDFELNGCLNCGICTATCPAAHYYDFSPREIVQLLWTENLEGIYDAMQEKIWACAQCYTCAARCPFGNSPGGLVMLMREAAIKHGMTSAKDVLRPFSRVMLKLVSTGNQLSPDMITAEHFPDWGPNVSKINTPLDTLRKAIPMPTLNTTKTAWEVNLKTSVELYTIWEETGVLDQLETIDENLFDVITDFMDEKRDDWEDFLEDQEDPEDRDEDDDD
jgi:heterodisulfide reductase subunit C